MNSIRIQLMKIFPEAEETFGHITKVNRQLFGLPKEHYYDAVAIAAGTQPVTFATDRVILKKCVSDSDYQMTKGVRSQKIPLGKIMGFRKFDKVTYNGYEYFIKGRMTSGYAHLMKIDGKNLKVRPMPKLSLLKRISARKSWIIDIKTITI